MQQRRIEDLVAWQLSRTLAADVYQATSTEQFDKDPHLRVRLRSTAGRVMTSIAAGYEQKTCRALADYLARAETAAAELRSLLYLAGDAALLDRPAAEHLVERTRRVSELTRGLRLAAMRYAAVVQLGRSMGVN